MASVQEWIWYLTRSTGIVAAVLAVAALLWGFTFSGRTMGKRLKAVWWMALHSWLGGLTIAFTGAHMLLAFLDSGTGLRFVDLLVPSTTVGWAIGWGVVAFWLFVAVTLPSIARIRRRLPRRVWHTVHLLAVPAVALTGVHAVQAGSDSWQVWFTRGLALLVGVAVYALSVRLMGIAAKRRAAAERTTTPTVATDRRIPATVRSPR